MKSRKTKLFGVVLLGAGILGGSSAVGATVDVDIVDSRFSPATVTIDVGDTVRWTQRGSMVHTTTSDDGLWNSGSLTSVGQTFSYTFESAGTFDYHCIPHASFMTGTVVVEEAVANPPVVNITAPADGTTLESPGEVTIEAEATVEGSTITEVEFFDGATSLGVDDAEPFSITINLAEGTHSLTAEARTAAGASGTSAAVSVTVGGGGGGTPIENPFPNLIPKGDTTIELEVVMEGLVSPLGMAEPDDGSGRIFVYEQTGVVHVLENGAPVAEPLLDVGSRMVTLRPGYDERGLLGLAVHPDFENNPFVYTYTSEPNGPTADFVIVPPEGATNNHQSVIAEWRIDESNPNRVDPESRREIMRIDEPQSNHNGGVMHFGPDGFLYVSLGDGGAADDQGNGHSPGGNGQDITKILGSVIRIDVDARTSPNGQYGVPGDNPFVGVEGVDEIYAYGFRNPFSWSFDSQTGEMYVADVGQNMVEELDRVFLGGNYGWPVKEGSFYFDQNGDEDGFITTEPVLPVPPNLVDPIAEYDHDDGLAIVGGYVYHGTALPNLTGRYIAGELGTFSEPEGRLLYLDRSEFKEFRIGLDDRPLGMWVKGFGQDRNGEIYLFASGDIGPDGTTGQMLKIVPADHNIQITESTVEGGDLQLNWANGVGPFVVQTKSSLNDDVWCGVTAVATGSAMVPMDRQAGFLRVVDMAGNGAIGFTAHLTGAAERPAVETTATGSGTLSLEGNTLHFDIYYSGLSGPAMMAHIHGPATAAESTGVLINLEPFNGGAFGTSGSISGSVTLTPEQKAHLLNSRTYVNIHTDAHGSGEIRGQIAPVLFAAEVTGAAERPDPVETEGHGLGLFLLSGNQLTFNISYEGLSSMGVNAHIHGPADINEAIGVLVGLADFNGGSFGTEGTLNGTVELTPDQLALLLDGLTYVNIHTENFGGGEIRGQIFPKTTAIALSASLSGAAERPDPVDTPATGNGIFALEGDILHFSISYTGLKETATMAHIHGPATAQEATGILIDLGPFHGGEFGTAGTFSGSVQVTPEQRRYILEGMTYANVHSGAHGSGEIRGQIAPVVMHSVVLGASERPESIETMGRGRGTAILAVDQLTLNATYGGLSSIANNAHIHGPATTAEAIGVLVGLTDINGDGFGTAGSFSGTVELSPDQLGIVIDEMSYINIHTENHGGGEIRGQLIR